MHKRKRYSIFSLILALVVVLAACGGSDTKEGSEDQKDGDNKNSSAYKVKHAMGTTEVPETPKKVVILTNEGTEALLSMGVKPTGAVKSWLGDPWYKHIKSDMEGVKVVGTESDINLEAIAALEPDLIIGNKLRQEKFYDQLDAIAPTVFSETLKGDWKENYKLYAKALNKEEEGNQVLADFDQRIEDIKGKLGDKVNQEVSVVRFLPGKSRIYLKDSFSGTILEQIGFKRPEPQDKPDFADEVTKEQIPNMDGDILFYFTYETGEGEASKTEKEWTNDSLWKNLDVVKEGNAHKVSDAVWNTAGGVLAANEMLDDIEKKFDLK
ncbi:ABC transporter substrate-binding protein [Pseudalkalibacillus berkeleyi]|uniref:Iron-siderophore ABC transporter substrate-binding protein n=1 Tax=Pseudalkalibacillus berkeleyi TaxID=1069813 RepID=A0ABS9H5L1_9BACL|nr:iron-siderophore ABC transporter substrate-binding protein [Pseudalkalibacillus berkeleyi]MCF6139411.1 iron-siderophore ABC transporter substrate-binding protein [Pseudalkalibacillus berkeleyi]